MKNKTESNKRMLEDTDEADYTMVTTDGGRARATCKHIEPRETRSRCSDIRNNNSFHLSRGFGFDKNTEKAREDISTGQIHTSGSTTEMFSKNVKRQKSEGGKCCILKVRTKTGNKDFINNTYLPAGTGRFDLSNDNDLEMDVIIAGEVCARDMKHAPKEVPPKYEQTSPDGCPLPLETSFLDNKEPDQTSTIYIQHRYEDNPIGDEFGTDIWTFRTKSKDGTEFDQHYFVNVKPNGPAAKMKIRENDELVLFNSIFVPNKTHNDLLNLFHKVKIDGRTRIELVIRRVSKVKKKKIWEWIDTSAILGPDCHHDKEKYLEVISPRETTVQGNIIEFRSLNKYRIKGYSQHYLEINNDTVVADVMTKTTADKKKIFLKIVQCYWNNDTMMFDYKAALYSESAGKYIVVGSDNQIKLDEQIMWFGFKKTDEHPEFKSTSNGLFLGCNRETHKIEMQTRKDDLEEFSAESGTDHPDQSRPINAPISYNGTSICYAEKYATCSDLCEKMSKEHCLTARSEGLFHQSGLETMSTDGGDIQMDDLRDHSETAIVKTNMTLHIPGHSEADARRSSEINKTPVTPFKSMLILI